MCNNTLVPAQKETEANFMRSKKKSIAVLSAMLALVLAVQAFAFTAAKLGDSKAEDSVKAGVTRRVMDAKPENKTTVVRVRQSVNTPVAAPNVTSMKQVTESIAPQDVEKTADNVRQLSEEDTKKLTEIAEKKIADEKLAVGEGEILYIPVEDLPEDTVSDVKNLGAGIAYDPNTGLLYGVDGHGLLYIGFDFDSKQGIFYNPKYPWQRNFGFCEIYDVCAPITMMFYDTQRYKFDYEGKNWMIQVWKGQYGITSGAEIGVYTKSPDNPVEFYSCASDEDCLKMSFDLYKKGELFFHREDESHWWLTGFAPLTATSAADFDMKASITCKSTEMAKALAGALEDNGYVLGEKYWIDGAVVSFFWEK